MKNTQPNIYQDKAQTRQLPKLQLLKLEQLDGIAAGGTGDPDAEWIDAEWRFQINIKATDPDGDPA